MRLKTILSPFIFTLGLLVLGQPVQAQLLEQATKSRDVAMLFHKMSETDIDYDVWAMNSQEYATAVDERKESVLDEERLNVQMAYAELDPKNTDIVIRTQITTKVEEGKKTGLVLDFAVDGPLFFPYTYLEENYALIAQNIDLLKFIPLGKLEATYIKNKISSQGKTFMVLKVRPHKVDTKEQTQIYDKNFWMMLGRVASIHLYNKELETLWSWTADWYISELDGE